MGTQSRLWFAGEGVAAAILALSGVVQLLSGSVRGHQVFGVVELAGGVLMGLGLLIEWVRNGPRA